MDLQHLSDEQLLVRIKNLARSERNALTVFLHHIHEVERRRLHSDLGYSSLFQYTVEELGYPEDQAHRRVAASRMLKELPEIEVKIQSGDLNLTHIGLARKVFRSREHSREEKLEFLAMLEGKSARDAAALVAEVLPSKQINDRVRELGFGLVEIRFTVAGTIKEKIEAIRGKLAHKFPDMNLGTLFSWLCDEQLNVLNKTATSRDGVRQSVDSGQPQSKAALRRAILSGGACEKCGSRYALEIDHKIPRAKGGTDHPDNLRLLCRSCNQRAAIEALGQAKMDLYL